MGVDYSAVAVVEEMWSAYAGMIFTDEQVVCGFFALAYKLRVRNLPDGMSVLQFTQYHLDRLGIGQEVTHIRWGSKRYKLPLSSVGEAVD